MNQTILIVDDDLSIRTLISTLLEKHQFTTLLAKDGDQMRDCLAHNTVNLIILDIMLPGEDGLSLCQQLRSQTNSIPILMVTAITEDIERIIAIELGADDYLSKPFIPRELVARVKALLRRSECQIVPQEVNKDYKIFRFSGWTLDKTTRTLKSPDNTTISLSSGEYDLLAIFVDHPEKTLHRDTLMELTKNRTAGPFDRGIDIQISRLRQKIETNPKQPDLIKTIRGSGYILATQVERLCQN